MIGYNTLQWRSTVGIVQHRLVCDVNTVLYCVASTVINIEVVWLSLHRVFIGQCFSLDCALLFSSVKSFGHASLDLSGWRNKNWCDVNEDEHVAVCLHHRDTTVSYSLTHRNRVIAPAAETRVYLSLCKDRRKPTTKKARVYASLLSCGIALFMTTLVDIQGSK